MTICVAVQHVGHQACSCPWNLPVLQVPSVAKLIEGNPQITSRTTPVTAGRTTLVVAGTATAINSSNHDDSNNSQMLPCVFDRAV